MPEPRSVCFLLLLTLVLGCDGKARSIHDDDAGGATSSGAVASGGSGSQSTGATGSGGSAEPRDELAQWVFSNGSTHGCTGHAPVDPTREGSSWAMTGLLLVG